MKRLLLSVLLLSVFVLAGWSYLSNGIFYTLLRRKQELTEEMKELIRMGDFRTRSFRSLFAIDQHDYVFLPERVGVRGQEIFPR